MPDSTGPVPRARAASAALAFEKQVKRRVIGRAHDFFAVCPPGLTGLCKRELEGLADRLDHFGRIQPAAAAQGSEPVERPITNIQQMPGGIAFRTRLATACLANLALGSPTKILMRIAAFKADRFPAMEKQIQNLDWALFLPPAPDLDIQVSTRKSRLYHTRAIAERCRPLILEQLSSGHGKSSGPAVQPFGQTLMIRVDQDRFELSLNMSGDLLFRRGIKTRVTQAPLRETLAFAVLKALALFP